MSRHTALFTALILLGIATALAAAPLSREEAASLATEADALFQQANEVVQQDPAQAAELYRKSALRYERIVRDAQIHNGRLYYNIGNAYFRMKDIGRAILNYRRAQHYLPGDPNLDQNLQYARTMRQDAVSETPRRRALRTLFFWHYDLSLASRSRLFLGCFVAFWTLAILRLLYARPGITGSVIAAGFLSLLLLGSCLLGEYQRRTRPEGVVLAGEVVARKGDSESYERSFTAPLHAGTEFQLLDRRNNWYYIRLVDRRECWIPADAAELIDG